MCVRKEHRCSSTLRFERFSVFYAFKDVVRKYAALLIARLLAAFVCRNAVRTHRPIPLEVVRP